MNPLPKLGQTIYVVVKISKFLFTIDVGVCVNSDDEHVAYVKSSLSYVTQTGYVFDTLEKANEAQNRLERGESYSESGPD